MLAFTYESELLSNELVGSALPILDVIRCFYVLGLALSLGCPLLTVRLMDNDGALVAGHLRWREAGPTKNLDLKSGETTR
jgi:hypothetical protein